MKILYYEIMTILYSYISFSAPYRMQVVSSIERCSSSADTWLLDEFLVKPGV